MSGGRASKQKGNGFERECVNEALACGLQAKRAWGSNGEALGMHEEVDMLLANYTVQCKRRKKLPQVLRPSDEVDLQLVREDHGEAFVIIPYTAFLHLLTQAKGVPDGSGKPENVG